MRASDSKALLAQCLVIDEHIISFSKDYDLKQCAALVFFFFLFELGIYGRLFDFLSVIFGQSKTIRNLHTYTVLTWLSGELRTF